MHDRAYDYWLVTTEGIGAKSYRKLLEKGLDGKEVFHLTEEGIWKLGQDGIFTQRACENLVERKRKCGGKELAVEHRSLTEKGISFCLYGDRDYPKRLLYIPKPPVILYYKGSLPKEESLTVAVIGARDCSEYGAYVAKVLGEELACHGITVVSGMARGVDSISQKSAAGHGGEVFAVLGSGVDVCYPRENLVLYEKLCSEKNKGVLSEYAPGTEAKASLFPARNRIISGLSDVIVVIEARLKSGTLITVDMALEQGKEVYVVPGRITDRLSDGCNRLIREGAVPFLSPCGFVQEILQKKEELMFHSRVSLHKESEMTEGGGEAGKKQRSCDRERMPADKICFGGEMSAGGRLFQSLSKTERSVYANMDIVPQSVDMLAGRLTDISLKDLLCTITMLQLKGLVGVKGNLYYRILL